LLLIKKIKKENLSSIKLSNKTHSIEINNTILNSGNAVISNKPILVENNKVEPKSTISLSIDSPMVGIVYLTPKPSSPAFVKVGQKIKKGDTICLIEAMKTFNEIKSDKDCTVISILIKNGEAVEFGQPLFEIS
jgi:acetyl-CoA carboxylase biotin carboxyl carrier protein